MKNSNQHNSTSYINGIDVSHHNGIIDWAKVKNTGIQFVFIKCTEGTSFKDNKFETNWQGASGSGLVCSPYHFYSFDKDPIIQADFFVSRLHSVNYDLRIPPVLDVEIEGTPPRDFEANVLKWLMEVESKLGVKPIIYVSHYFANTYLTNTSFSNYELWLAEYNNDEQPNIPTMWKDKGWAFWQNTPKYTVDGINGFVDHDFLNPDASLAAMFSRDSMV